MVGIPGHPSKPDRKPDAAHPHCPASRRTARTSLLLGRSSTAAARGEFYEKSVAAESPGTLEAHGPFWRARTTASGPGQTSGRKRERNQQPSKQDRQKRHPVRRGRAPWHRQQRQQQHRKGQNRHQRQYPSLSPGESHNFLTIGRSRPAHKGSSQLVAWVLPIFKGNR